VSARGAATGGGGRRELPSDVIVGEMKVWEVDGLGNIPKEG